MTENLTELEVYRPSDIQRWAVDAKEIYEVAKGIALTSFVPKSMRDNPYEVTATILAGSELRLGPMTSLRSINVIQGTPALTAVAMRGLVQGAGHDVWLEEASNTRAIFCGRRQGSERVQRSEWTTDRAKDLGLLGKQNWKEQPKAMLIARATSELCRLVAADVLLGMPYSAEELSDDVVPQAAESEPAPKRKARRALVAEVQALTEPATSPPEPVEQPDREEEPELEP